MLFLFCCSSAFSIMKYDDGRLQDVLFCFKTHLHENIENEHPISVPDTSLNFF